MKEGLVWSPCLDRSVGGSLTLTIGQFSVWMFLSVCVCLTGQYKGQKTHRSSGGIVRFANRPSKWWSLKPTQLMSSSPSIFPLSPLFFSYFTFPPQHHCLFLVSTHTHRKKTKTCLLKESVLHASTLCKHNASLSSSSSALLHFLFWFLTFHSGRCRAVLEFILLG